MIIIVVCIRSCFESFNPVDKTQAAYWFCGEGRKSYPFYLQINRLIVRQPRIFVSCRLDDRSYVFIELEHFDKSWETIDNDKERFYFCMRYLTN